MGGRATLYGAVIGAILVNYGKTVFTGIMPEAWLFALGGLFVAVTVFLPHGLVGLVAENWGKVKTRFAQNGNASNTTNPAEGDTP